MTIDTTFLNADTDKVKGARPALLAMAVLLNTMTGAGGAAEIGFSPYGLNGFARSIAAKASESLSLEDFGFIGDGTSHPLSERYASLALAQADYPHATALTQQIDWAAAQGAMDYAKANGIGVVYGEGRGYFTTDLTLRNTVVLAGVIRHSLVLLLDGCTVTHEMLPNSNPSCRDTGLRATIQSVNGTETTGLLLKGAQYSNFDVKVSGFNAAGSIGILCTSAQDPGNGAWRYATNNVFHDPEVTGCYRGIKFTKNAADPATFGASFNKIFAGYINNYTVTGVHVEHGEANSFYASRCTTNIGGGSIGWLIEDSMTRLDGCTADGGFGGSVPGTVNIYGFPHGRDGDTTTRGFVFNAGSSGSVLITPRGDGVYNRVTFDSQTTADNVAVIGGRDVNALPDLRVKRLQALSDSAVTECATFYNRVAASSTVLCKYKNGSTVNPGILRVLSNGAIEFGSGDSDTKLLAGNVNAWRAAATTLAFQPENDNTQPLCTASRRASVVYAGTGTINTSDEREKDLIEEIPQEWLDAWADVQFVRYKWRDAVTKKGDGARWHVGVIAQRVRDAFEARGIDPFAIGILCYDKWPEEIEDVYEEIVVKDASGEPMLNEEGEPILQVVKTGTRIATPAGNRYGIRYEEALALECAYLRSKLPA